jgi:hypothetical protein
MALSNAERQKRHRQRRREQKLTGEERLDIYVLKPFSEWFSDQDWQDVIHDLDIVGVRDIKDFPASDDAGPFSDIDGYDHSSLRAAEQMVTTFLDAAVNMASKINSYKLEQINDRIANLIATQLDDPEARKQALADIATLSKYRDELDKSVRWTLPQWKVKGE